MKNALEDETTSASPAQNDLYGLFERLGIAGADPENVLLQRVIILAFGGFALAILFFLMIGIYFLYITIQYWIYSPWGVWHG